LLTGITLMAALMVFPTPIPAQPMDAKGALRMMREARSSLKTGDAAAACDLYDRVVARFPTWWMSLVGRVRCGLERGDPEDSLVLMLARAERFEAPADIISDLRSRLLQKSGKTNELCERLLPAAIRGEEVSLPRTDLLVYAWIKGRLGDALRVAESMRDAGQISPASLRLGAEAALLTKDAQATDALVPEFLDRHPDRVLMVRYIRDLGRRGRKEAVALWTRRWRALIEPELSRRKLRK
jgi:hypothetical protein